MMRSPVEVTDCEPDPKISAMKLYSKRPISSQFTAPTTAAIRASFASVYRPLMIAKPPCAVPGGPAAAPATSLAHGRSPPSCLPNCSSERGRDVPPVDQSLPYDVLPLSGVSYGDGQLRNDDDVKRLAVVPGSRVVTASPDGPQPHPARRTHFGCRTAATDGWRRLSLIPISEPTRRTPTS